MNIQKIIEKKSRSEKLSMITCYDYSFAHLIDSSKIDLILVGDSGAMVMHGHPNTLTATMDMMCLHTSAVAKGAPNKFIVADLPFLSFRKSLSENMNCVERLMQAGAHALKLEGAIGNLDLVKHIVQSGVPVMGHLGLTPQSIFQLGGFKVQGREAKAQSQILADAKGLEEAGCFSIVLECVPSRLSRKVTESLSIPTIGIGAGPDVDGQVLVLQDMLGMNPKFQPKFLKQYFAGAKAITEALDQYALEVQEKSFPGPEHSYE